MSDGRWIKKLGPRQYPNLRLFCFPYAGGGASAFRTWAGSLPSATELCAVQLPGREDRFLEPPLARVEPIVASLAAVIPPFLDLPFALFGHSMGALIAFELARALRVAGSPSPRCLLVSGQRPPQVEDPSPPTLDLPETEFRERLRRTNGTPPEVLNNPELMEVVAPVLRADFAVCQTYCYSEGPPLDCPIIAFGGRDDPEIAAATLECWREQTDRGFRLMMFPGDHFYLRTAAEGLLKAISDELTGAR